MVGALAATLFKLVVEEEDAFLTGMLAVVSLGVEEKGVS